MICSFLPATLSPCRRRYVSMPAFICSPLCAATPVSEVITPMRMAWLSAWAPALIARPRTRPSIRPDNARLNCCMMKSPVIVIGHVIACHIQLVFALIGEDHTQAKLFENRIFCIIFIRISNTWKMRKNRRHGDPHGQLRYEFVADRPGDL